MSLFNWKIAGAAGEGIKISGLIFSQTCFNQGLNVCGYTEYPSLIRGGLNTFQVTADIQPVSSPELKFDLEISLADQYFIDLCRQNNLPLQTRNIIALGLSVYVFSLDLNVLNQLIKDNFSKKSQTVVALNLKAAQIGYDYAAKNYQSKKKSLPSDLKPHQNQIYLTGNEAISLGALAGGLQFFAAYPMTPVTAILHFLAAKATTANLAVRQAEDEIGVINMAIGAAYAGLRSMVATSGGGFSLMTETLGLSGMTETPLVIVNGMRPGPSTGMPTWSSQGDLLFAINAGQDEFPRIVLAPGDCWEAFELTKLAQNLAEKYQLPVIILSDKYLAESYFIMPKPPVLHQNQRFSLADTAKLDNQTPFARYRPTDSGISLRSLPGQAGGICLTNSYEHDELGYATEASAERQIQVDKRNRKTLSVLTDPLLIKPTLFGPARAATTIISWGSNKGVILQALKSITNTNFIHFSWLWPFPKLEFLNLIKNSTKLITLECNSTGQLNRLIRQETGLKIEPQLLKYDGRPFFPEEIIKKLKTL